MTLNEKDFDNPYRNVERDEPKRKHKIVMDKGEWIMNKKIIQDRINGSYNGR